MRLGDEQQTAKGFRQSKMNAGQEKEPNYMSVQNIAQMKQERAALIQKMAELNNAVEKEKRDLTIDEKERWEGMEREVRRLEGQITRDELQAGRENELAQTAWRAGHNGRVGSRYDGTAPEDERRESAQYETASAILRPDQSVRSYMEQHGLIKQPQFEGLTFGAFLRSMVTGARNDVERRALGESSDSAGGYSVPDGVSSRVIDKMRAVAVTIQAGAQTVPLNTDRTTVVRIATDPAAAWRVENASVAVADPTFEGVIFQPKSLAVIVKVSRELLEDSLNIEQALEASFTGAMAGELDRVALVGSGVSPEPQGIYGTTNVGAVSSAGTAVDWDKYIDGLSALWTANENVCSAIVLHPRTLTTLSKMKTGLTGDKTPLQKPSVLQDIPIMATTSIPINLGGGGAESLVIMGNFSRLLIGVRSSLRVEILRELYAGNHQYGFIAHLRADIAVEHPESFAVLSGVTA